MLHKVAPILFLVIFTTSTPSEKRHLLPRPQSAPPIIFDTQSILFKRCKQSPPLISSTNKDRAHVSKVAAYLRKLVEDEPRPSFSLHPNPSFGTKEALPLHLIEYSMGRTTLHEAAFKGDIKKAQETITNIIFYKHCKNHYLEKYINLPDKLGRTALWYAIKNKHTAFARKLFCYYASLYPPKKNSTVLHLALQNNDTNSIDLICKQEQEILLCFYEVLGSNATELKKAAIDGFTRRPALSLVAFPNSHGVTPIDLCSLDNISTLKPHILCVIDILKKIDIPELSHQINTTAQALRNYCTVYNATNTDTITWQRLL